jgi:hypothetical protein
MGELMEDHILNHMPRKTKSSEEAADDLIEIVRTLSEVRFLNAQSTTLLRVNTKEALSHFCD